MPAMPWQTGAPGPAGQEAVYRPLDAQTVRAIVEALGQIGNRSAQQLLATLIAGKMKTDDDRAATEAALECLAAYPRPEYENMLFIALTAPEKVRPSEKPGSPTTTNPQQPGAEPSAAQGVPGPGSAGGRMTAEEIQKKALSLVESTASDSLRLKVAKYLAEASTPETHRALLSKFLLEDRPENVAAQVAIYGSPMATTQIKASLEAYFQRFSSYAVGRILGVPVEQLTSMGPISPGGAPSGQPGPSMAPGQPMAPGEAAPEAATPGSSGPPGSAPGMAIPMSGIPGAVGSPGNGKKESVVSDPALPYRIAQLLWSPKFSQALQTRLEEAESLDKVAQDIAWASTIPTRSMRTALCAALHKHVDKGAKPLLTTGILNHVVNEPGFAVVLKTLPRKDASAAGRPAAGGADSGRASGGLFADRKEKLRKAKQERDQAEGEWLKASEDVIRGLCQRLHAAAQARAKAGIAVESAGSLPLELPDGITVGAEYHLTWPGALGKKLTDVSLDPIRLHYVRYETRARPSAVVGVFRRRVSQPVIHMTDLGPWVDSFRPVPKTERKMSIDILISKAKDLAAKGEAGGTGGSAPGPIPGATPEATPGGAPGEKPTAKGAQAAEETVDLVVEILTVEMRDPGPQAEEEQ